ncbi:MAG: 5-formyltetrahydrofolate cyclo-ligase [Oscillospiraceae bacterium]|nr:5-formyltetrahydrofolate cyclo-ligase [Oscillospiraceae bacterium]
MQEKVNCRQRLKQQRALLTLPYRQIADSAVCANALSFCRVNKFTSIFCFVGTAQEIQTLPFIKQLLQAGMRVCVPRCIEKGVMQPVWITDTAQLKKGAYGILEPDFFCEPAQTDEIDVCMVPCLATSFTGTRLGYGGGYYDRFLAAAQMPKAALCYSVFIKETLPAQEWDVKMDYIISEREILFIKK